MILSNPQQFTVLLWSLLFGVGLGAVYDLFRAFRCFVSCPAVAVFAQDLLYFLFAALASFVFIFEVNDGTVRLFILLAFLAGGLVCRFTLGRLTVRLCGRMVNFLHTKQTQHTENNAPRRTRKVRNKKCIRRRND